MLYVQMCFTGVHLQFHDFVKLDVYSFNSWKNDFVKQQLNVNLLNSWKNYHLNLIFDKSYSNSHSFKDGGLTLKSFSPALPMLST